MTKQEKQALEDRLEQASELEARIDYLQSFLDRLNNKNFARLIIPQSGSNSICIHEELSAIQNTKMACPVDIRLTEKLNQAIIVVVNTEIKEDEKKLAEI